MAQKRGIPSTNFNFAFGVTIRTLSSNNLNLVYHFRNLSPGNMDMGDGGSSGGTLTRRSVKNSNANTPMDEGWKQGRNFSAHNSNVGNFESFEGDVEDNDSIFTDVMSPSGHTDAQTLACMLQEQLDAINNEIRY